MSYGDSNITRVKKLIKNPRVESGKVIPFILSKINPLLIRLLEGFGFIQKPFSGHDYLMPHVNFRDGFFIQVGGMDGFSNDPTYYLEKKMGWRGLIIEPMQVYKVCQKNRKKSRVYNFAAGSFDDRNKIVPFIDCYGMSFVKDSINNEEEWIRNAEATQGITSKVTQVTIKPIQDIIDTYFLDTKITNIDLLVIDTEGYEYKVIQGIDFNINSPKQLLIEISQENVKKIVTYLSSHNYTLVEKINNDYLFKHESFI